MLVWWYLAYSLSYRDIEELALERGLKVDHSTVNRWVIESGLSIRVLEESKDNWDIIDINSGHLPMATNPSDLANYLLS